MSALHWLFIALIWLIVIAVAGFILFLGWVCAIGRPDDEE